MSLTELAAVRYGLASKPTLNQPRSVILELVKPALKPVPVSVRTGGSVLDVARELEAKATDADPVARVRLRYQIRDIEALATTVNTICDEGYAPDQAVEQYREIARKAMTERFRFPFTAKPHQIMKNFPPPNDRSDSFGYASRDGIYLKRDHLFPGLTEIIVLHENVHSAIRGQGYVPWFDEGVANLLSYLLYAEQTGDCTAVQVYRTYLGELSPTVYWYPEFDRAMATLVLLGWQSLLFALIGARVRDPGCVDWPAIPQLLMRGRPLDEIRDKCFPDLVIGNFEFFSDRVVQRVIGAILAPSRFISLSPVAYAILERTLADGELPVGWARGDLELDSEAFEAALQELNDAYLAVTNRGRLIPTAGADKMVSSGMVRISS